MYDCSRNFNEFYHTKVILPEKSQNELREKRKTNIKRLKSGLSEYNSENNTGFRISEERIQGSMAMHTVVQNDENDYDIDVGIVIEYWQVTDLDIDDKVPVWIFNAMADRVMNEARDGWNINTLEGKMHAR
ncbi:hypothetical protein S100892_00057 (plasmid) [Pediococcus pentosaceus]|uniref:Cyclic GMP-AMP synthase n=2 Tax=Lactobacillaceae TaxID=33958 RepID=A0A1Y0VPV5_PEDPE|nr:hypothetical protein S100892_00057 [Pediococcus pentosaceus]